jgi:hypothetical protein
MLSEEDEKLWFERYKCGRRRTDWGEELWVLSYQATHADKTREIGAGGFTRIQWHNRRSELSFYVGDDSYRNERVLRLALQALLHVGFLQFGFHKITWPVFGHDPWLPLYKEILREEAVLREEYFWNGTFHDRHYLALFSHEFQNDIKDRI